ncbi:MAG: response regulator transcription factor [Eubacteriales bacterium]|nr:response regulator transcription factor [Eubacteriales bacterium]
MRIVIIDDDILVVNALKIILEAADQVEVAGVGTDGAEAVSLYRTLKPDVLLMDIRMKGLNGLDAAKEILREDPQAKILLLTTFSDDEYIVKALNFGVKGYLLKQDYASIVPALMAVCTGQTVFGTEIISKIPHLLQKEQSFDYEAYDITPKEYELITLVAQGLSNREIAGRMFLSEGTVRNYLSNVLEKLGLRDRTQLAVFYYQHS